MSALNDHLTDILSWMESRKLKLYVDKTDIINTDTKQTRNTNVDYFPVKLLTDNASPSYTVRNLGLVFDCNFSFHQYISQVCKSWCYQIRDFRRIRRHLTLSPVKAITVALINSHLDQCNSHLNHIAKKTYLNSNVSIVA